MYPLPPSHAPPTPNRNVSSQQVRMRSVFGSLAHSPATHGHGSQIVMFEATCHDSRMTLHRLDTEAHPHSTAGFSA